MLTRRSLLGATIALVGTHVGLPADAATRSIGTRDVGEPLRFITGISHRAKAAGMLDTGRLPGSRYEKLAADYVERQFRQSGLADVRQEAYPLIEPAWTLRRVELRLSGRVAPLETAFTGAFSPTTPPGGLTAELVDIGDGSPAARAGRDLTGKIVLIHSHVDGISYDHPARKLVPALVKDSGLAGLIIAIHQRGDPALRYAAQPGPLGYRVDHVPWTMVSGTDGNLLAAAAGQGTAEITLIVDGQEATGGMSQDTIGVVPGLSDETILITAHTDSHWEGATDNASGLSVLVALARYFGRAGAPRLRRTLAFVATGGHHDGPSGGQKALIAKHADLIARTALVMNLEHVASRAPDGGGKLRAGAGDYVLFVPNQNPAITAAMKRAAASEHLPVLSPVQTFWTADYHVYAKFAKPAVMLLQPTLWYHTDGDTADKIDLAGLAAVARAHAAVITELDGVSAEALKAGTPSLRYGN